jgi:hypothetical protein
MCNLVEYWRVKIAPLSFRYSLEMWTAVGPGLEQLVWLLRQTLPVMAPFKKVWMPDRRSTIMPLIYELDSSGCDHADHLGYTG